MGRNRRGSHARLIKKCKASVKACPIGEKPKGVKTHLRNMVITPDMVGSVVECYGGKYWTPLRLEPTCADTTSESSPSPTSPSVTERSVMVPPEVPSSLPSDER